MTRLRVCAALAALYTLAATLTGCHMRTYASLVEGDDFTEPQGTRP